MGTAKPPLPPRASTLTFDDALLARAGRLVDRHAMIWTRTLHAPIETVWRIVSTRDGLAKWWIVPPSRFELRRGGTFAHHWTNVVTDFEHGAFIDFAENTADYSGTGGMRFELDEVDRETTVFSFLDTWGADMRPPGDAAAAEQPGGAGTPWPGVAAGWHAMVDKLNDVVDGTSAPYGIDALTSFYASYLRDWYRWHDMVQRQP